MEEMVVVQVWVVVEVRVQEVTEMVVMKMMVDRMVLMAMMWRVWGGESGANTRREHCLMRKT